MTGVAPNVLYLDFDGVLHHAEVYCSPQKGPYIGPTVKQKLFAYAGLLEELLLPYPALAIVLSTFLVLKYGSHGAARHLPHGLCQRVLRATLHTRMNRDDFTMHRGGCRCGQMSTGVSRLTGWHSMMISYSGRPGAVTSSFVPFRTSVLAARKHQGFSGRSYRACPR